MRTYGRTPSRLLAGLALAVLTVVLPVPFGTAAHAEPGEGTPNPAVTQLVAATGGAARFATRRGSGQVRFFGTTGDHPVPRRSSVPADAPPEAAARAFLSEYGGLFGVGDQAGQLRVRASVPGENGSTAVRFQQVHGGIPVVGGELAVVVDAGGGILSTNGETSPNLTVSTTPAVPAATAARIAVTATAKWRRVPAAGLVAAAPELSVYDPALLGAGDSQLRPLVWRTEVLSAGRDIREFLLVDAVTGAIVLHFDQNPGAKNRFVCNRNNVVTANDNCVAPYTRVEGGPATGTGDVDLAYDYAGITYDFYKSKFNRDSLDGLGMPLKSTVKYCPDVDNCPYANAYWDGVHMVYGAGFASADDVVAHELTHGVTEFTSGLFYYFQSGAINESMSDVFGELIDLTDGRGNDSAEVRWDIGEDLPIGAIRNMMQPSNFGDPDRMTSPSYQATRDDYGGVHGNSGVNNKAAALMVDGGAFNGQTIAGLGTDKVARVYYEALTRLMTSATDYNDLYDILQQACTNLVGTHAITATDCVSVRKAVTATEMNLQPPGAEVPEAPICDTAGQVRTDIIADNLENPAAGNWVKTVAAGFGWAYPQSPNAYPGYNPKYATSGVTEIWGDDPYGTSDATIAWKTGFVVPAGPKTYLRFAHAWGFEDIYGFWYFDGGVVEYTTNNGTSWVDAGSLATHNGYNADAIASLGDRPGYGAASGGYLTSRFDLSSLAGHTVRFRFRLASDDSIGDAGWFIDDVQVYTCAAPQPAISVSDARVTEVGVGGTSLATFTVSRTSAVATASVKYVTVVGTATSGGDFTPKPLTTLSFAAGEASRTVTVAVTGDAVPEAHETFYLILSAPSGASLVDATGAGVITDDDAGTPASLSVNDPVVTEGNTGSTPATFTITRSGSTVEPVTLSYATATGSAGSGDFTGRPPTPLTIPAGATSATVPVAVTGDVADEANETFSLVLSGVAHATLADATGTATIVDNDGPVTPGPTSWYAVSDVRVTEGGSGAVTPTTFTITRSGSTTTAGSVAVSTEGGTATRGVDYSALVSTTLSFAPGQASRTVTVDVMGDTVPEAHERFGLKLASPTAGLLADDTGTGTITDSDAGTPASFTVNDVAVSERGSGAVTATFTVLRLGVTTEPVTVNWATTTATAPFLPAATAGPDYVARPATTLAFAAGETSKTVTVQIVPDSVFEPNEYFFVTLASPGRATIGDAVGIGTIIDDD